MFQFLLFFKDTIHHVCVCIWRVANLKICEVIGPFIVQGVPMQTVKSNLDQTERKNTINFDLKVNSDQGRLGNYP